MGEIPIYEVQAPDYVFNDIAIGNKTISTPYGNIPIEYEANKPDFSTIGQPVDECLKKHFLGKRVLIRALGSQEHVGKSVDDLIRVVCEQGYDRYDPQRVGDRYENVEGKHIDLFALEFTINRDGTYMEHFIEPFYYWCIKDRGFPVRVDILILYDPDQLAVVEHRYKGREDTKTDGYVFKYPNHKSKAILGVVKIL